MDTAQQTPLRVLVVEDSEDDCLLLLRELRRGGYEPAYERVETLEALQAALEHCSWDIVFADYTMPRFSGAQALECVRRRKLDVPFIFVSGTIGEDTAVAAMKSGAQDFLMKGHLKRLLPAVERELSEIRVRRERERAEGAQRAAEARYRHILTMAADAIIAVDDSERITVFNHGAERIFGYRSEDVQGRPLGMLLPERFKAEHGRHLATFGRGQDLARRMNERGEVYGLRKDGSEFPAEASIARLHEDGRTASTVILRDVTERKRTQDELRLLQAVIAAASEATDARGVLAATLETVCDATGWSLAQAWVPEDSGSALTLSTAWHSYDDAFAKFRATSLGQAFQAGQGLAGRVWASREPLWLRDVSQTEWFSREYGPRASGLKSAMAIPVLAGNDVVAVLEFFLRQPRDEDSRTIRLMSSVAAQLGTIIQRKRAEERLHYLAHHDQLTGLPNRVLFRDRLERAMLDARRDQRLVGIAFLDLDRFKTINDSLGHAVGDMLLKALAERLSSCLRESDTVARLSGDEFAMVLGAIHQTEDAAALVHKIMEVFAAPFHLDGHELFTTASLGMTLYPLDDRDAVALLRNADIAMYRAKDTGGNGYEFYSAEMTSKAQQRLALENDLRHALARGELRVHYQPIVDIQTGCVVGLEALARWDHPHHGPVPPTEFIALAEESGLIARIGERVLRLACEQCLAYAAGPNPLPLAVNVSIAQVRQPNWPATVASILETTHFPPSALALEITESVLMHNPHAALAAMRKISALGVHFAIDDFGTGYSSLAYLKQLPLDVLKIDQAFVRAIPGDVNDVAIVTALISMAHKLGFRVIAEGVETREQLAFLRAEGCEHAQGYYLGIPMPASELHGFLADCDETGREG